MRKSIIVFINERSVASLVIKEMTERVMMGNRIANGKINMAKGLNKKWMMQNFHSCRPFIGIPQKKLRKKIQCLVASMWK